MSKEDYIGKKCWNSMGTEYGVITGARRCNLSGCTGTRLGVKWPDGKRTWPCSKGCRLRDDGDYQVG